MIKLQSLHNCVDLNFVLKEKSALHVTTTASFSMSPPSAHKQCGMLFICHSICVCLLHRQELSATCSQWESSSPIFSFRKRNKTIWQESTILEIQWSSWWFSVTYAINFNFQFPTTPVKVSLIWKSIKSLSPKQMLI